MWGIGNSWHLNASLQRLLLHVHVCQVVTFLVYWFRMFPIVPLWVCQGAIEASFRLKRILSEDLKAWAGGSCRAWPHTLKGAEQHETESPCAILSPFFYASGQITGWMHSLMMPWQIFGGCGMFDCSCSLMIMAFVSGCHHQPPTGCEASAIWSTESGPRGGSLIAEVLSPTIFSENDWLHSSIYVHHRRDTTSNTPCSKNNMWDVNGCH